MEGLAAFDARLRQMYHVTLLCGVDEAGRGPLAGDVYAAACILPEHYELPELNDSKQLSEKKRDKLFDEITRQAVGYAVATASVEEIERLDIRRATMLAMSRAVRALALQPEYVIVDGNFVPDWGNAFRSEYVIGGDGKSDCIAAASILAKVSRDRYMKELAKQYPEYAFEQHKGYGTALHYRRIEKYGVLPIHRQSFLKKKLSDWGTMPPQTLGFLGERYAAEYLIRKGYEILDRNYAVKSGEIDIVARKGNVVSFAEVKSRRTFSPDYLPKDAVTKAKQARLVSAAKEYIREKELDAAFRFDVIEVVGVEGKIYVNLIEDAFSPAEASFI